MPKILSPIIHEGLPGLWFEGPAYEKKNLYSISSGKAPPVNYDSHTLKPHSLTHIETSLHTQQDGMSVDQAYKSKLNSFHGAVVVLRLENNNYVCIDNEKKIFHWVISLKELLHELAKFQNQLTNVKKVFITTNTHPTTIDGYHDPSYVLTLSQEAADYLVDEMKIDLYGTSWKSSDYNPGSSERPIHNTIFKSALIVEYLDLVGVEQGIYFLVCAPLPIKGASESPVVPVLFSKDEIEGIF